jgi:hypothetical protein
MDPSAFSIKCETHLYYARLPFPSMGDTCNIGRSRNMSPCSKILGLALSLATLSNFSKPPSDLALMSP